MHYTIRSNHQFSPRDFKALNFASVYFERIFTISNECLSARRAKAVLVSLFSVGDN
jgi:hypothetical protein